MLLKQNLRKILLENNHDEIWYHGTPDVRALEQAGGFDENIISVEYIKDLDSFNDIQNKLQLARENGNEDLYFKLLDQVPNYKSRYKMQKPVFLTNDYSVAKTYADPSRSMDYQNAKEKVLKVTLNPGGKALTINAYGDRFRFISLNKVKRGFLSSGISENEFTQLYNQFNYFRRSDEGIKTDNLASIAHFCGFDYVDVIGVLDSYDGGKIKSTVRMVFDPKNINIV